MHDRTRTALEWLQSVRGRRFERVLMEHFVWPDGRSCATPSFVWLQFEGAELKRVKSLLGESVAIDTDPPDPKDMGDVGSTVVRDVSDEPSFRECVGSALAGVAIVRERGVDECAGFELIFENGGKLMIVDCGDQLLAGSMVRTVASAIDWIAEPLSSS